MNICINCGNQAPQCLCNDCRGIVDIENLCREVLAYKPEAGNELWDRIADGYEKPYQFRDKALELADLLPSPRREYLKILRMSGGYETINSRDKDAFELAYDICIRNSGGLSRLELNEIKGLKLRLLYWNYDYMSAEKIANVLIAESELPLNAYDSLVEFYTKTRRYSKATALLTEAGKRYNSPHAEYLFNKRAADIEKYMAAAEEGRMEYLPKPSVNRQAAVRNYEDFMRSIGISTERKVVYTAASKYTIPIAKELYPAPKEHKAADFTSFVAFDLETTGTSASRDAIIEIGAAKYVNGCKVAEFKEFVKPFKKRISDEVTRITGITNEDVKNAREMWEVFPDFMRFAGGSILLGYNCMAFDSKFLVRAGRYSNRVIHNEYFDVMKLARKCKNRLYCTDLKLDSVSRSLGIYNPRAHRALDDAITTAKVYLKLKWM